MELCWSYFLCGNEARSLTQSLEATFEAENGGTTVSLFFKGIPSGIRPEDNEAGTQSSLEKLARYVEEEAGR